MKKLAALSLIAVAFVATEAFAQGAANTAQKINKARKMAPAKPGQTAAQGSRVNQTSQSTGAMKSSAAAAGTANVSDLFKTQVATSEAALGGTCKGSKINDAQMAIMAEAVLLKIANADDACLSGSSQPAADRVVKVNFAGRNVAKSKSITDLEKATLEEAAEVRDGMEKEWARDASLPEKEVESRLGARGQPSTVCGNGCYWSETRVCDINVAKRAAAN